MYDPYAEFSKYVLSNGLEIYFAHWDRPWVGVEIVVHSGGREDPIELSGLAHFVEHTVSENTLGWQLSDIRDFFDSVGGRIGLGSTGYLATKYGFGVPAEIDIFKQAVSIFGSMLLDAEIKKCVERERKVIYNEFSGKYPFLEKLKWDMEIGKALFKGHRLETWNGAIGLPEGFSFVTESDLQGFYNRYYVPKNMSLVILGGLHIREVLHCLENSSFGIKKIGQRNPIPKFFTQFPVVVDQKRVVKLSDHVSFKCDQAEYKACWAIPADFPEQAQRVFSRILEKLLFQEIREKRGLSYGIRTDRTNFQDVCQYVIKGNFNPSAVDHIDDLVRGCISMVPSRLDLFKRSLGTCIKKSSMLDLSGEQLIKESAGDLVSYHKIITMQEILEGLHEVRYEQMSEMVSFLSSEHQYTFIAHP